jgi:hypothetical protein
MMRPAQATGNQSTEPQVVFLDCAAAGTAPERPDVPMLDPTPGFIESVARPEPWRLGPRGLLIGAFAASVLVALSGAFLIGLAVVGVVAAVIAGFELVHRHLWRAAKAPAGAFDHHVGF